MLLKFLEWCELKIPSDLNMSVSQLAGSPYVRSVADSSLVPGILGPRHPSGFRLTGGSVRGVTVAIEASTS